MSFTYPRDYHRSGQLQAGRIKDDPVGFLVIAEVGLRIHYYRMYSDHTQKGQQG